MKSRNTFFMLAVIISFIGLFIFNYSKILFISFAIAFSLALFWEVEE